MNYFKVLVTIKERKKLLGGIREFGTSDYVNVYYTVWNSLRKYYTEAEIEDVKILPMPEDSDEVKAYLQKAGSK